MKIVICSDCLEMVSASKAKKTNGNWFCGFCYEELQRENRNKHSVNMKSWKRERQRDKW